MGSVSVKWTRGEPSRIMEGNMREFHWEEGLAGSLSSTDIACLTD